MDLLKNPDFVNKLELAKNPELEKKTLDLLKNLELVKKLDLLKKS